MAAAMEPYAQTIVASANVSNIKIDGVVVDGAQSFSFKVDRDRRSIYELGSPIRKGVDYGPLHIAGALQVRTTFPKLDEILLQEPGEVKSFQVLVELKKGASAVKTMAFDQCYLERKEFSIEANGQGLSTYYFTATKFSEQQ